MIQWLCCGYAFGGGGSGDSTRERDNVATSVATLHGDPVFGVLTTDSIATLLEQVLIARQQSGNG